MDAIGNRKLGNDAWAKRCRARIRHGLRKGNMVDFGYLRVWHILDTVRITDGNNLNEYRIQCASVKKAKNEMRRIADGIEQMQSLHDILGISADELPEALASAL